jgi:hypothetical protein
MLIDLELTGFDEELAPQAVRHRATTNTYPVFSASVVPDRLGDHSGAGGATPF